MSIVAELGDVAEFIRGVTFKPNELVEFGSQDFVVCMRTKNVQKDLDESDLISIPRHIVKNETKFLKEGDLLISTANSFELVGKACWVPKLDYPAAAGGFISILRAKEGVIDPRYLYHWVKTGKTQHLLRHCGRQTTNISNMDFGRAKELKIPLPPLEEQKRIAAILDKADGLRRKRQQAIDLTDQLLRSVFLDMFGDPVTNPKGWERIPIARLSCESLQNGAYYPKEAYTGNNLLGTSMIHMADAFYGLAKVENAKRVEIADKEIGKYSLQTTDLLVARRSLTLEGAAKPCRIPDLSEAVIYESSLIRIRPDLTKILTEYLYFFLSDIRARQKYLDKYITSSTISGINQGNLAKVEILVPDISKQKIFVDFLKKCESKIKVQQCSLLAIDNLVSVLTQQAFRGELTKQAEVA